MRFRVEAEVAHFVVSRLFRQVPEVDGANVDAGGSARLEAVGLEAEALEVLREAL